MLYASTAETCDVPYDLMTPDEIKAKWPLIRTEDLKGALYHHTDGYINPADVTMAMAKGARQRGVVIERKWQADAFHWNGDAWDVTCTKMVEKGGNLIPSDEQIVITAEHVVTASGNHAQRTAKMLGIKMPAIPVEHQFIVMDQDPALVKSALRAIPNTPSFAMPMRSLMCAKSAAAGSWVSTKKTRLHGLNTVCQTVSAPICSSSIWSGSKSNTWR